MNGVYRELIASARVSTPTRQALAARAREDDPAYAPQLLDAAGLGTLRALVGRIVPQAPAHRFDLAARIDQRLAKGVGDGWRFSSLPADPIAYRIGLRTLDNEAVRRHGSVFSHLDPSLQDDLLTLTAAGHCGRYGDERALPTGELRDFDGAQMRDWFAEVRADAVRLYVAHPETLARIGYSGIANGGDGLPKSGFVRVGLGEREDWEPLPCPDEVP